MYCPICNHSWCWSCGFPSYSWFHTISVDGMVCKFINSFIFGFQDRLHICLKIPLAILAIILGPPVSLICAIGYMGGGAVYVASQCFPWRNRWSCCTKTLVIPIILIQIVVAFAIGICLGVVGWSLGAALFLLVLLIVLIRVPYQWCLKSRSVHQTKE
jgi:hypothetical protein